MKSETRNPPPTKADALTKKDNREALGSAAKTLTSRLVTAIGGIALSLVVGNELGASGLGTLMLGISAVVGAATLARLGTDQLILRDGSIYIKTGSASCYRGLRRLTIFISETISIILATLGIIFSEPIASTLLGEKYSIELIVSFSISLPFYTAIYNQAAWIKAFRQPAVAPLLETGSISFFVAAFLMLSIAAGVGIDVTFVSFLFPFSAILTSLFGWFYLCRIEKIIISKTTNYPTYNLEKLKSLPDYFAVSLATYAIGWAPILVLGAHSDDTSAGLFAAAYRIAFTLNFVLTAFNSVLAPKISYLFHKNDMRRLEIAIVTSARHGIIMCAPFALLLIIYPEKILILFGEDFAEASVTLVILTISQIVNLMTGSVGFLLNMTGNQKTLRKCSVRSAVMLAVLLALLVPNLGIIGAALATAASSIFLNSSATYFAFKLTGIRAVPGWSTTDRYLTKRKNKTP